MSEWSKGNPCPACGSRDNLKYHIDGHGYCFGCGYRVNSHGEEKLTTTMTEDNENARFTPFGDYKSLPSRKISEEVCKHFGYRQGHYKDAPCHVAVWYDDLKRPVAAKLRFPDKSFSVIGDKASIGLYGQWLYKPGGKRLVITEGELDALSVAQAQTTKWPVVSVPHGAQGAAKAVAKALEWVNSFETVVIAFDGDGPGQKAAEEVAALIDPGKAAIVTWPEGIKDASDLVQKGRGKELVDVLWNAKPFRPDGIISGADIDVETLVEPVAGYDIHLPKLNTMIGGLREGELTLLTAGSGIGKSTLAREIAYDLHRKGLVIGNVFLEENNKKTAQAYIAIHKSIPLGELRKKPELLTSEEWKEAAEQTFKHNMYFYDHFGSLESDNLLSKLKYMRTALGCNFVVLDHISIVVSGAEGSGEGERRDIDKLMTKLRSLIESTGLGVIGIVHLKQPEGKPHEEGGRVTLSQLRGSGALKQLSDNVIAIERDQQGEDPDKSVIRVLKCREFGETGLADELKYHRDTGRLLPVEDTVEFPSHENERDF